MVETTHMMRLFRLTFVLTALAVPMLACNVSLTNPAPTAPPTNIPAVTPNIVPPFPTAEVDDGKPTSVLKSTPSYVPATPTLPPPTVTPVPTVSLAAKVCSTCVALRVREGPDTAQKIIVELGTGTAIRVTGRTTDGMWFQVVTPDGRTGWAYGPFITVDGDINTVNILNIVGGATPTPITPVAVAARNIPAANQPLNINVVSGVTSRSRQIFLAGQTKGNIASVFTRVGDSITAAPQFLHQFATDTAEFGTYEALAATVGFFSSLNGRGVNPFLAASLAERNFWRTDDVLNPANAPSELCQPGETPLSCEYRLVRPSVSLIMIGTNDAGQDVSPEQYSINLQRIVRISIDMGVIPVLSTIPPKHLDGWNNQRVDQFNAIIVQTARANDIPLWNLWLALQNIPNNGLTQDGVHLNAPPDNRNITFDADHLAYGYPVRNLTALQVLDVLRQQVLYGGTVTVQTPGSNVAVTGGLDPGAGTGGNVPPPGNNSQECSLAPLPRLSVGGKGRVTPGLPNKIRSGPNKAETMIGAMQPGDTFSVIGGPVCHDSLRWWQVSYNGLNGWSADGQGSEYWLEPAE
jgi:uncharacterized protein YraI